MTDSSKIEHAKDSQPFFTRPCKYFINFCLGPLAYSTISILNAMGGTCAWSCPVIETIAPWKKTQNILTIVQVNLFLFAFSAHLPHVANHRMLSWQNVFFFFLLSLNSQCFLSSFNFKPLDLPSYVSNCAVICGNQVFWVTMDLLCRVAKWNRSTQMESGIIDKLWVVLIDLLQRNFGTLPCFEIK